MIFFPAVSVCVCSSSGLLVLYSVYLYILFWGELGCMFITSWVLVDVGKENYLLNVRLYGRKYIGPSVNAEILIRK